MIIYKVGQRVKIVNGLKLHGEIGIITEVCQGKGSDARTGYKLDIYDGDYWYDHEFILYTKLHEALS